MIKEVDMSEWIWDSDKKNVRKSTYEFYEFLSFDDIDSNDFITICGHELGEYMAITIIREEFDLKEIKLDEKPYRYKIIFVGAKNLITYARAIANQQCYSDKERHNTAVFIAPTASIVEDVVSTIIKYLVHHHIEYNG